MFHRNATTYMTPSGLVGVYQRFEETYCLYVIIYEAGGGMFIRKSITAYQSTRSHNPAYCFYNTNFLNNSNLIQYLVGFFIRKRRQTDR